jgi:HD-GYP domain-containing protein (c-di-GMP phosphodiesterase class II)
MARIIGLADTFDAMSSTRSYRPAMPRDHVLREIERGAGSQFDPRIVDAFKNVNLVMYDEMLARSPVIAERVSIGLAA